MYISTILLLATLAAVPEKGADGARLSRAKEEISQAWHRRSEAMDSGIAEWEYVDDAFGRFEIYWIPTSLSADMAIQGRLQFSPMSIQYRSHSFEYPDLGNSKAKLLSEREFFRTHLLSHFQDSTADERKLLPYTITVGSDSVVHYWQDDVLVNREYPRAVVLPPQSVSSFSKLAQACAFASDSHDHDSSVPSPVVHQLSILPFLLSFRPALFDTRLSKGLKEVEISFDESGSEIAHLATLALAANSSDENSLAWKLFVDPALDYSVRRAIGCSAGNAVVQCDMVYDQDKNGTWIPSQWTVQVLGSDDPAYVRQVATFRQSLWDLNGESSSSTASDAKVTFADTTWVNDLQAGTQFIVTNDEKHWDIPASHQNWHSYDQILALSQGKEIDRSSMVLDSFQLRRLLANLTQWPGLILPLSIVGAGMFLVIRLFSSRGPNATSTDATELVPGPNPSRRAEET